MRCCETEHTIVRCIYRHSHGVWNVIVIVVWCYLNEVSVGLAYVVTQGNMTATIIWFGIVTGVTVGLSYNKEKE